jgi:hypothetical protein
MFSIKKPLNKIPILFFKLSKNLKTHSENTEHKAPYFLIDFLEYEFFVSTVLKLRHNKNKIRYLDELVLLLL